MLSVFRRRFVLAFCQPPRFDEFPVNVNRVVEVEQQAFAAIEKA
jgi:hypothetical protein